MVECGAGSYGSLREQPMRGVNLPTMSVATFRALVVGIILSSDSSCKIVYLGPGVVNQDELSASNYWEQVGRLQSMATA